MEFEALSQRHEAVLRCVIHHYILTAKPVGSRTISRKYGLGLSPATIRNVMADLEEADYLSHPHTSAGRIPTTKGYRLYVTHLMEVEKLTTSIKRTIAENVETLNKNVDVLMNQTSNILAMVSQQLGVVIGPALDSAVIEKISLVSVSSDKVMVIITLGTGFIKSIVVEVNADIAPADLEKTSSLLNDKLAGLQVSEILRTISSRLADSAERDNELVRLFIDSAQEFFDFDEKKIFIGGAVNIVDQPEYSQQNKVRGVIELVEQKDVIVHLLNRSQEENGIVIKIGDDTETDVAKTFSIVSSEFSVGNQTGMLGVIGPTRMWYPKMVPLVNYTADVINKILNKED